MDDATEQTSPTNFSSLPAEIRTMIWQLALRPTHLTLFCAYDHGMLYSEDITWDEHQEWTRECDHVFLGKKISRSLGCAKRNGIPIVYFLASPPPLYRVCRESCALLRKFYPLNPATPPPGGDKTTTTATTTTTRTTTTTTTTTQLPPSPLEDALPPWFNLRDDVIQVLYHDLEGILSPGAPLDDHLQPMRHLRVAMHRSLWQRAFSHPSRDKFVPAERLLRVMHILRLSMPQLRDVTFVVAGRGPGPFWANRTALRFAYWFDVFEQWCVGGGGGGGGGVNQAKGPFSPPASSMRIVARHEDGTEEEVMTLDNFLCVLQRQLKSELPPPGPDGAEPREVKDYLALLDWFSPKHGAILRATEQELENPFAFLIAHREIWHHGPDFLFPF